ncbi:methyltransferase domain-containing protein [Candidatus Bathyarchaeota archaeon]|nr:methyltransferase domain-containing protein [Candidatus Bathyarchaeota archaeon]
MADIENTRESVLKASRSYYKHQAFYEDFLAQRRQRMAETTRLELDFLEYAFRTNATYPVRDVLDVACGGGRHIVGLAQRGYRCTGQDYTLERVKIAKAKADREKVTVKLSQGDATRLDYENEFDAVLALYILFLLPNDDDVLKCLQQIHRALKPGGILICNIGNPFFRGKDWFSLNVVQKGYFVQNIRVKGMRYTGVNLVQDFDPLHGVVWWQDTSIIEASDGVHVFRDRERLRLFTYWDIIHYLQQSGFKENVCYPDWKTNLPRNNNMEKLVFVSCKD